MTERTSSVHNDPWRDLRRYTSARLALGRSGVSLPTDEWLAFSLAHAQARDAVHVPLDTEALAASLREAGLSTIDVHSAAADRATYLLRPDLGRRLSDESVAHLKALSDASGDGLPGEPIDLQLVIGDGLSSLGVAAHASELVRQIVSLAPADWRVGPVVIARQARVALADHVGELLGARLVAMIVGERPGLTSPDSLGIYLTWAPQVGRNDAERNCISNVRPQGLPPDQAARRFWWLCQRARQLRLTGVGLKDESPVQATLTGAAATPSLPASGN